MMAFPSLPPTESLGMAEACFLPASQGTSPWAEQALQSSWAFGSWKQNWDLMGWALGFFF